MSIENLSQLRYFILNIKKAENSTRVLFFCAFYYLVNFTLTPNEFSPVHQDDYILLGRGLRDMAVFIERPVTLNFVYLIAEIGVFPTFLLVSAIVVFLPIAVIHFFELVFGLRYRWYSLILFSAICFGHFSSFENGKYLGSVVGVSGLLGSLTLLSMLIAWGEKSKKFTLFALIGYGLTCFSREDFLLPPLILLSFFYLSTFLRLDSNKSNENLTIYRKNVLIIGGAMTILALLSVIFSAMVGSRFATMFSSNLVANDPYAVRLTISSVMAAFQKLTLQFIPGPTIFALFGLIVGWFVFQKKRMELIVSSLIIFLIILPYTIIPNNLPSYRVVGWLPWLAAFGCMTTQVVVEKIRERLGVLVWMFGVGLLFISSFYVLMQFNTERQTIAGWYVGQQSLNKNMLVTLQKNSDLISREKVVAIRGVEGLSPWGNTDAEYLRNKLGYKNKWVVLVNKNSAYNTINYVGASGDVHTNDYRRYVTVAAVSGMCDLPDMLLIDFDKEGLGELNRTSHLCLK